MLLIAGLPKSGTTWLADLLGEVPGYRPGAFDDPDNCVTEHDVCDAIFESLPRNKFSVLKFHTSPTPSNFEVIERHVERTVVMSRDLRDQCVSRYYHILNFPPHPDHSLYARISPEEALARSIELTLSEYVPWVEGWQRKLSSDDRYLDFRYEALHADPAGELGRVLDFYGIDLSRAEVAAIVERVRAATRFGLEHDQLARGKTARAGRIGDWRTHFTPDHVARFKAGAGDLLIALGYEDDLNWSASTD